MTVPQDKLRAALEMLHKQELKDVAYDRGLDQSYNRRSDLIDEITDDEWTEDGFDELIDLVERLEKEDQPKNHYIMQIENISQIGDEPEKETILAKLGNQEVGFTDDSTGIEHAGFEINEDEGQVIKGTYWTKTEDYILNPLGELRPTSTLYGTGFKVNLDERRLYIQASLYGKAQGLRNIFGEMGVTVTPVGFQDLTNDAANDKMAEFVDEFEERLDELDEQSRLGDH